ncbi:MAG TPA: hypothetical protein VJ992_10075 [Gemmatimonadales bacterium]|jgi:hypothetical protein|nr:hypothetical protein [Gemmatimonadales bacterium]
MRKLLLALGIVALAACAGKEKAETPAATPNMAADTSHAMTDTSNMADSAGAMKADTTMARDTSKKM